MFRLFEGIQNTIVSKKDSISYVLGTEEEYYKFLEAGLKSGARETLREFQSYINKEKDLVCIVEALVKVKQPLMLEMLETRFKQLSESISADHRQDFARFGLAPHTKTERYYKSMIGEEWR